MKYLALFVLCGLLGASQAFSGTASYVPLGRWIDPQISAYRQWETGRQLMSARPTTSVNANRPLLPGLRPKNLELLQDALQRKFTTKVPNDILARKHIVRLSGNRAGMNVLNGAMAEALMIEHNPNENWAYVKKPNAPQHDLTRVRSDGVRVNAQVKFHTDGNPATYAADMKKDWRATHFAVPDDHVQPLKTYLEHEYRRLEKAGDIQGMKQSGRDLGRVRGIGVTSTEIQKTVSSSARYSARQQFAIYTSLGASLAMSLGPTLWDWANGDLAANQAIYRAGRALSLLGIGIGTDMALQTFKHGALRGTLRGNLILGTAVTITETTWLIYEHGWGKAFSNPNFYESMGGSVGGMALGLIGGGAAAAWVPGPGWVVGGASIIAGVAAGTVGYFGGRAATHMVIEMIAPKALHQRQVERLWEIRSGIDKRIEAAKTLSVLK